MENISIVEIENVIDSFRSPAQTFGEAIQNVGPSPCQQFKCKNWNKCAEEAVECFAFRIWVNSGKLKEKKVGKLLKSIK